MTWLRIMESSGVGTRLKERPEGRRLYDKLRSGDMLVVRWVDRLGRNYGDVTDTIREFMRRGVVVRTVINDMTFDGATADPQQAVRDAMISFMAATAQAQAEATREAQRAGIAAAQRDDRKYRGKKPSFSRESLMMAATCSRTAGESRRSPVKPGCPVRPYSGSGPIPLRLKPHWSAGLCRQETHGPTHSAAVSAQSRPF